MHLAIVELAAWVIVGKAAGEFIFYCRKERRQSIQMAAVKAEYNAEMDAEYSVDETLPEFTRARHVEQHRERQRRLLMRYPQYLISDPDWKYFKQAEGADKADRVPWKMKLLYGGVVVGGILLGHFVLGC